MVRPCKQSIQMRMYIINQFYTTVDQLNQGSPDS
ncbi:Uncharacterised protein [Vibrio cholerae]|nr:Uncharacterised protein [Vibrio cholerae]CSH92669.1 Uncharacterised protein [Vibrio cholerae]CSI32975.1 Uncharacterised protein [Vibrio cholerae]